MRTLTMVLRLLTPMVAITAAWLGSSIETKAQDFPTRPPWLIIPYPPGGGVDTTARLVQPHLSERIGQQIVIDNKPGASTVIGTRAMAAAAPDGYTIGIITDSHAINAASGNPLSYDSDRDFTFISQLVRVPLLLIVNANKVPARSLGELVAFAKQNPGKLTAGSIGVASPHHIGMQWFKSVAGIDIAVVPFRGIAPSLQAMLSGEIDMMLTGVSVADQYVKSGAIRQIAVASPQRLPSNPDLPTFAEQGYPDFNLVTFYGLVGPAKMPDQLASFWREAFRHATGVQTVRERINASGADVVISSPSEFSSLIRTETAKFKAIFQATGIKPEL